MKVDGTEDPSRPRDRECSTASLKVTYDKSAVITILLKGESCGYHTQSNSYLICLEQ